MALQELNQRVYMIGDLIKISGLTRESIKHYIRIGLIEEVFRSESNFRMFDRNAVERLLKIKALRLRDVPLEKIRDILERGGDVESWSI